MIEGYFAKWHGRPLKEITPEEVFRLHQRLGKENGPYAANRAVALLRTMFNLARDWGHLEGVNPAARIKFYRGSGNEPAYRTRGSMTCAGRWGAGSSPRATAFP